MSDVILHSFNWHYEEIERNASAIRDAGYGAVLLPPPLYSDETIAPWWQRYQPRDYRVLRSYLGTKKQLVSALRALKDQKLLVYVDIVFNHMANEAASRSDALEFPGKKLMERYADPAERFEDDRLYGNLKEPLFDERSFHPNQTITNWLDDDEVAECWLGALPDLTLSVWVVRQQLACLSAFNELGVDGYRVDAIKHLPEQHIHSVFENPSLSNKFVFGEILTFNDKENQTFLWPALQKSTMSFYDFPMQQTLKRAFSLGGSLRELVAPAQVGHALPWNRAVTFSVTHDVPNNDGFRGMLLDPNDEMLANVYLLGRDGGLPLIYSDHGESCQQHPEDTGRWQDLWNRPEMLSMLAFHNQMQGLPERCLHEQDGVIVLGRGNSGIVAINKTSDTLSLALRQHSMAYGDYQCLLHGYKMTLNSDPFPLNIAPRSAQMWAHKR